MFKLINKKAFYLVLAALLSYWAFQLFSLIYNVVNIDASVDSSIELLGVTYTAAQRESLKTTTLALTIIGFIIVIGLSSIFLFKLLGHRKRPMKGTYLTVLLVFACIIGGFNLITLFSGNILSLIPIAIFGLAVAGYVIQKNEKPAPFAPPPQFAGPGQQYPPQYPPQYGAQYPFAPTQNIQQNPYANPYQQQPPPGEDNNGNNNS